MVTESDEENKPFKEKELTYVGQRFVEMIKMGGKLVSRTHGDERMRVCRTRNNGKPCEYFGKVTPIPGVKCIGCTDCGCALLAKAYMKYVGVEGVNKEIKCTNEKGNQWAQIDHKFNN